ncbi:MAG: replication-associated recombination protein A [Clostridiales bacterium]|nr:replication-associated recombination protein A [Clostridiales bacterium]
MQQMGLFDEGALFAQPLASRLRPTDFNGYVGQKHLVGEGKILRSLIEKDMLSSMIFWGPPGVGKTTLARLIAHMSKSEFIDFSAVTSGIKEIKAVMERAESLRKQGLKTILFVDEIHRFNKAQQDAFLPFVEKGSIILIGATTENPSFEINSALLSRCKVFVLKPLEEEDIVSLIRTALTDQRGFGGMDVKMEDREVSALARFAAGDARTALNTLEMAVNNAPQDRDGAIRITKEVLSECTDRRSLLYDKQGEEHYNLISALHKSMRNSDPDAAVYWLSRMLDGGEDPLYIARRIVRFASEDIGMADSRALTVAVGAYQACTFLGMPECDVHLAHAAVYMAMAPKSNAVYMARNLARADVEAAPAEPVPLQIRNAPTQLMKQLDYGKGYIYAHDTEEKMARMTCLPDSIKDRRYYLPTDEGEEKDYSRRLDEILRFKNGQEKG